MLTFSQFKRCFMHLNLFPHPFSVQLVSSQFRQHATKYNTVSGTYTAFGIKVQNFWQLFQNMVKSVNLTAVAVQEYPLGDSDEDGDLDDSTAGVDAKKSAL